MPNLIAYLALYSFPLVVFLLFRRLSVPAALCWTIVLGYLFLPERGGLNLPMLPRFGKSLIPSLFAALCCFFVAREVLARDRRGASGMRGAPAGSLSGNAFGGASGSASGGASARAGRGAAPAGAAAGPAAMPEAGRFRSARGQRLQDAMPADHGRFSRAAAPAAAAAAAISGPGIPQARSQAGAGRGAPGQRSGTQAAAGAGHGVTPAPARAPWITALFLLVLFMPFLTMLQNGSPIASGGRILPGIRPYDAGGMVLELAVMLLPFMLARRFLVTPEAHATLLRVLALCGLAYSLLIVIEVRLSPQLNVWIYGFMNHSFVQHMRAGGYRPMVFLNHGLWVGIFMAMAVISAFSLFRWSRLGARSGWLVAGIWLFAALVLSKTMGALGITLALLPVLLFCGVRIQLLVAAALGMIVLFYPMLRGAGLVPVDHIHALAAAIDTDRANSLLFRLNNEDMLLARANEKPLFGWGGWGRSLIFNEAGDNISVLDGTWIILMGINGWVGYIAQFGLLTLPILALALSHRRLGLGFATSGLALVLVVNLVDLLPNATLTPLTWLVAGALAGRYEMGRISLPGPADAPAAGRAGPRRRASPPLGVAVPGGSLARRGG